MTTRATGLAAFFSSHTLNHLLGQYGYGAVLAFVMVESLGVPFPGETMVIAAALYAGVTHQLVVWLIWAVAAAGAIIGDNIGFGIGSWGGYRLLRRCGARVRLDERKLKVGRLVFDRHGAKVVFLAASSRSCAPTRRFWPAPTAWSTSASSLSTPPGGLSGPACTRSASITWAAP